MKKSIAHIPTHTDTVLLIRNDRPASIPTYNSTSPHSFVVIVILLSNIQSSHTGQEIYPAFPDSQFQFQKLTDVRNFYRVDIDTEQQCFANVGKVADWWNIYFVNINFRHLTINACVTGSVCKLDQIDRNVSQSAAKPLINYLRTTPTCLQFICTHLWGTTLVWRKVRVIALKDND